MSNYKRKTLVPHDTDVRSIREQVVEVGGILRNAQEVPISGSGGAVDSVNGQMGDVVLVKADLGLANVDNTSDLNKPVSLATQAALSSKADLSYISSLSGSLESAISDIEDFKPADTWYVDGINGIDIGNDSFGSFNNPYKTIGAALSGIGSDPLQKIFILAIDSSAQAENITITQSDLIIQGIGGLYSHAYTLNAHITISGATRLQLKDLHINGTTSGVPTIQDLDTSGTHIFDNVTITHDIPSQYGYITNSGGTNARGANFSFCDMSAVKVDIQENTFDSTYNFINCANNDIEVSPGNFVFYKDSRIAGPFLHTGGVLVIQRVTTVRTATGTSGSPAISSSADAGVLSISDVSLIQPDASFGHIDKTGACPYAIGRCGRDPTLDILTGFRFFPESSIDISASYTPNNYSTSDEFLPSHLVGIDTALGLKANLVGVPATASSPGNLGDYSVDGSYVYFCIATDTWVRATVGGW